MAAVRDPGVEGRTVLGSLRLVAEPIYLGCSASFARKSVSMTTLGGSGYSSQDTSTASAQSATQRTAPTLTRRQSRREICFVSTSLDAWGDPDHTDRTLSRERLRTLALTDVTQRRVGSYRGRTDLTRAVEEGTHYSSAPRL